MSGEALLQTISDVIAWIFHAPLQSDATLPASFSVDIRAEMPDETAMRIMNALRILRYPPPRDMDQMYSEK